MYSVSHNLECLGCMITSPFLLSLSSVVVCPWGMGSETRASSKYELQGSLDVPVGGLQRPQHQLLVLDPHVPELLHLGLPAALATQKHIHGVSVLSRDQPKTLKHRSVSLLNKLHSCSVYFIFLHELNMWDLVGGFAASPVEQTCWRLAELAAEPG